MPAIHENFLPRNKPAIRYDKAIDTKGGCKTMPVAFLASSITWNSSTMLNNVIGQ